MKKLMLFLAAISVLTAANALAADIPAPVPVYKAPVVAPPPPFTWTGFYVGGFVGGGTGSEDPTDINQYGGEGITSGVGHIWAYKVGTSFIPGATIGANYQYGRFVIGAEGEAGYVNLNGCGADPRSPGMDVVSCSKLGNVYELIAGRFGVAVDHLLFYGKAGVVFTNVSATVVDNCSALPCGPRTIAAAGSASNQASAAVGGGVEWAFHPNWSVKVEYMWWALDNHFLATGVANDGFTYNWDHNFSGLSTVKVGVNYRFGS